MSDSGYAGSFRSLSGVQVHKYTQVHTHTIHYIRSIYIDAVQHVSYQTLLHGQAVDKSGSGKSRAQHLDMSRCWALPFWCPLVADLQRTSCRQAVDKL